MVLHLNYVFSLESIYSQQKHMLLLPYILSYFSHMPSQHSTVQRPWVRARSERKWKELRKRTRSLDVAEFSLSVIHPRENKEDFAVELRSL